LRNLHVQILNQNFEDHDRMRQREILYPPISIGVLFCQVPVLDLTPDAQPSHPSREYGIYVSMVTGRGREVTVGGREKEVVLHVCKFTGMHTRTHYRCCNYESNSSYASAFPDYTHTHTHSYDTFRYELLTTHTHTHTRPSTITSTWSTQHPMPTTRFFLTSTVTRWA